MNSDGSGGSNAGVAWPRHRSVLAGTAGVLAVITALSGILGFWTVRTATDSARFEARIEESLVTEEVSNALARFVVAELVTQLDVRDRIASVVPETMQPTVDLLLAGVRSRVELRLGEVFRSEQVVETIGAAAGTAHRAAVDLIEGDGLIGGLTADSGEVRINLLPLTARAIEALQEVGLFRDVDVPDLARDGDPSEQRTLLGRSLGRTLPPDFGEPVVFRSDALDRLGPTVERAQDVLVLARRTFWGLLIVGVVLAGVSIRLSAQRWRAGAFLVAGLFAATLIVGRITDHVRDRLPEAVEQPGARATVAQITESLERSLDSTLLTVSVAALVVLLAASFLSVRVGGGGS